MLLIFIILKNPSPQLALNQQTLGPTARKLIITTLRQLTSFTQVTGWMTRVQFPAGADTLY
jgi:hypothetical protein